MKILFISRHFKIIDFFLIEHEFKIQFIIYDFDHYQK